MLERSYIIGRKWNFMRRLQEECKTKGRRLFLTRAQGEEYLVHGIFLENCWTLTWINWKHETLTKEWKSTLSYPQRYSSFDHRNELANEFAINSTTIDQQRKPNGVRSHTRRQKVFIAYSNARHFNFSTVILQKCMRSGAYPNLATCSICLEAG